MKSERLELADIEFVKEILKEAGEMALTLQIDLRKTGIDKNLETQNLLTADEKVSNLLVKKLKERFANDTIISEEDLPEKYLLGDDYAWLIDPIDGTHHYLANDNQYSIMIGLLKAGRPIYGWIYNPAFASLYYGGPNQGIWRVNELGVKEAMQAPTNLPAESIRVILGRRDRKRNPWLDNLPGIRIIQAGSIGYKLTQILENQADVLVHLAGCLKVWDTAGPVALAVAAGLEVGSRELDYLIYPQDSYNHPLALIMGKKGSLDWFRSKLMKEWTH